MKEFSRKALAILLVLVIAVTVLPAAVSAEGPTVKEIYTASDLSDACTEARNNAGEYVFSLQADIETSNVSITNFVADQTLTVTILGNGHKISNLERISASKKTILNLGAADGSDTLDVVGRTTGEGPGLLTLDDANTVVNMYNGVTLKDHKGNNYFGGGVTVMKAATFNMFGGVIDNCGINGGSVCFGGGVAVVNGGTFNMYDGTISNCYATTSLPGSNKGLIPWGAGGGVFVGGGSTFNMEGGTITDCKASESGGGVFVVASKDSYFAHSSFGYLDSEFTMTGGKITNNEAAYYGGGIAVDGYYVNAGAIAAPTPGAGLADNPGIKITGGEISGNEASTGAGFFAIQLVDPLDLSGAKIINNLATDEGSDLFIQYAKASLMDPSAMNEIYTGEPSDLTNRLVGAWFDDVETDRFIDLSADERLAVKVEEYAPLDASSGSWALIAAPDGIQEISTPIEIEKNFVVKDGYQNAGSAIANIKDLVNSSVNPVLTIDPYKSFNRLVGKDASVLPAFTSGDSADNKYTIDLSVGNSVVVELPSYVEHGVGDYWYTVTESVTDAAGVAYDEKNPRYLHVQVTWKDDTRSAIEVKAYLHTTAPEEDGTYLNTADDKTTGFTNKYGAGELSVNKQVTGNMGDPDKLFMITVKFTAPAGKVVTGDIKYVGGYEDADGTVAYTATVPGVITGNWDDEKTVVVYLKHGATVTFTNIPDGVTYEVTEADYSADGYTAAFAVDSTATETDDTVGAANVVGKITDAADKVTVTNDKTTAIDVGVILNNAPFVLLLTGAVIFMAVLVTKKRKAITED